MSSGAGSWPPRRCPCRLSLGQQTSIVVQRSGRGPCGRPEKQRPGALGGAASGARASRGSRGSSTDRIRPEEGRCIARQRLETSCDSGKSRAGSPGERTDGAQTMQSSRRLAGQSDSRLVISRPQGVCPHSARISGFSAKVFVRGWASRPAVSLWRSRTVSGRRRFESSTGSPESSAPAQNGSLRAPTKTFTPNPPLYGHDSLLWPI